MVRQVLELLLLFHKQRWSREKERERETEQSFFCEQSDLFSVGVLTQGQSCQSNKRGSVFNRDTSQVHSQVLF